MQILHATVEYLDMQLCLPVNAMHCAQQLCLIFPD